MAIPGNPRLVPVAGGEHFTSDPYPEPLPLEVGVTKLGDPVVAEAIVEPNGRVTLRGLDTVMVDGGPVTETLLTNGNRIALPQGDVVFQAEWEEDDGGRQGGEEPFTRGLRDVDTLDRS
ncbi:MAG: hypothetical protein ABR549_13210 [Mycobacteriales bacterium]